METTKVNLVGKENVGFTIIAAKPARKPGIGEAPCQVVIGYRQDPTRVQYVTWIYNEQTGGYCWGHYTDNFTEATNDYEARS